MSKGVEISHDRSTLTSLKKKDLHVPPAWCLVNARMIEKKNERGPKFILANSASISPYLFLFLERERERYEEKNEKGE